MLTGPNDFLLKQTLDQLVATFVNKFGAHGVERVSGEELDTRRLGELLQGASLFAAERLVVLRDALANKALWEALGEWVEQVPAETTLAVVEPSPDKRTKTYKLLTQHGELRTFDDLSEPELVKWLQATARDLGYALDNKVAHYLLQRVGSDQWRLWHELQKLANRSEAIDVQTIDELVEATPQATAFELLDAALAHRTAVVQNKLATVVASEDPYKLFGLLVAQIHALAVAKAAPAHALPDTIAKDSGLHPFVIRKSQSLARSLTNADLKRLIAIVALCDEQLKSTGADPWFLLGQCLHKLAAIPKNS